jgi:DNA-binding NarL/FixJ family response regulator
LCTRNRPAGRRCRRPSVSACGPHSRAHRRGRWRETLTGRELQVARLIADRRTNAQIAAELYLAPKTVETHIRNLFTKLDVSSRVEIARMVEHRDRTNG